MKTLSHCIEAYMWHRLPSKQIRFVNPKSKFSFSDKDEVARVAKLKKSSERYKEHKRMARGHTTYDREPFFMVS